MAAKVTVQENRNGTGYAVRVGKKAVAWVTAKGATVGRAYRASLNGQPIPDAVTKAIARAREQVAADK